MNELDKLAEEQKAAALRAAQINELKQLLSAKSSQDRYIHTINKYAPLLKVPELPDKYRGAKNKPNHSWVLVLSDLHIGQKTAADATGHLFEQSTDISRKQMQHLWKTIRLLHSIATKSINVTDLWILQLGDLVEGDGMRTSQVTGIDELVTKQTIDVVDILVEFIQNCETIFPVVNVRNTGGNHDRTSQKASYAGLGELGYHDTYAWLIAEFERRIFKESIEAGRLTLRNSNSFFDGDIIAGQRVAYEHGASFKTSTGSYGGIGWYPIQNAGMKYQAMLDGVDILVMGHHHTAACLPLGRGWQVLNGALPPSTPFVQSGFKRVTIPSQVLFEVHEDFGLVNYRPIYLDLGNTAKPGDFWKARENG